MANQGKRMVSEDQIKKLENLADIREAGENITIENGVISAAGGGSTFYKHNITTIQTSSNRTYKTSFVIINKSSTPLTVADILSFLNNITGDYPATALAVESTNDLKVFSVGNCIYASGPSTASYKGLIGNFSNNSVTFYDNNFAFGTGATITDITEEL